MTIMLNAPTAPFTTDRLTATDVRALADFLVWRVNEQRLTAEAGSGGHRLAAAAGLAVAHLRDELLAALLLRDQAADGTTADRCARSVLSGWTALTGMAEPWSDRSDWDALWGHPVTLPERRR